MTYQYAQVFFAPTERLNLDTPKSVLAMIEIRKKHEIRERLYGAIRSDITGCRLIDEVAKYVLPALRSWIHHSAVELTQMRGTQEPFTGRIAVVRNSSG